MEDSHARVCVSVLFFEEEEGKVVVNCWGGKYDVFLSCLGLDRI